MVKNLFAALPLFATAAGAGFVGMTLILAALHSAECACYILRRD